jgi:hypothetical protein
VDTIWIRRNSRLQGAGDFVPIRLLYLLLPSGTADGYGAVQILARQTEHVALIGGKSAPQCLAETQLV